MRNFGRLRIGEGSFYKTEITETTETTEITEIMKTAKQQKQQKKQNLAKMKEKNMAAHGLMFHHFHNEGNYIKSQGSISAEELREMLKYYQEKDRTAPAAGFYRHRNGNARRWKIRFCRMKFV